MNDSGIGQLMEQAKKLQGDFQQARDKIATIEVKGESGAGMVTITMNGRYDVRKVAIDSSLMGDDKGVLEKGVLEDLIAAAFNDGVRKVESETRSVFAGMVPPGMILPGMR